MEGSELKRAIWEVLKAALAITVFYLFAAAIAAVVVKATAPSDGAIIAVNWGIKCAGSFLLPLIFLRKERALVKGALAGISGAILSLLAFAAIGGGFHVTVWFLLELPVCALLGGFGALCGARLKSRS